jgi:hypothetical protein
MRRMLVASSLWIALFGPPAVAQEWVQYASKTDLFGVNFPAEPKVQEFAYATEFNVTLPGRVYSADQGPSHYSVTVVDYKDCERLHTAKAAECKAKGGEGDACQNDWRSDVQGAMIFASWKLMQRSAKVTQFVWATVDQVEGLRLQLVNADGSKTFAEVHRHGTRLYVLEATVPARAPAPGLFQQSLMFTDEEGRSIRYRSIYTTGYSEGWQFPAPEPPRAGRPAAPPPQ